MLRYWMQVDLISLDLFKRVPFRMKAPMAKAALEVLTFGFLGVDVQAFAVVMKCLVIRCFPQLIDQSISLCTYLDIRSLATGRSYVPSRGCRGVCFLRLRMDVHCLTPGLGKSFLQMLR